MRRHSPPLVLAPLEWKTMIALAGSGEPQATRSVRTLPEGTKAVEFDGSLLYLRPIATGEVGLGLVRPSDRTMPQDSGRMPDYQTAVHLIEHARNLGALPRPAAMLVADAYSFVHVEEDERRGRLRIYTTVREGGTYVITLASSVMTLEFQEDDEPSRAHDLMSLHSTGYGLTWPDFLTSQSSHTAVALRLIELHQAAMTRSDQAERSA